MQNSRGWILALLSGCGFGTLGVLGTVTSQVAGLDLLSLLAFRFIGMTLFMFSWVACSNFLFKKTPPETKITPPLTSIAFAVSLGAFTYAPQAWFFFESMGRIGVGAGTLLLYLYPLFVNIAQCFINKELLEKRHFFALILGVTGAALSSDLSTSRMDTWGILAGILAAVSYALYVLGGARLGKTMNTTRSTAYVALGAAIGFIVMAATASGITLPTTSQGWGLVVALIAVSTIFPIVTGFAAIRRIGPAKATILFLTDPLTAIILGSIFLNETLSVQRALGAFMIIAAVIILQVRQIRWR